MAAPLKIDAIAGAVMDAQFADPLADRLRIARMTVSQTNQPGGNDGSAALVLKLGPPLPKGFRLLDLDH